MKLWVRQVHNVFEFDGGHSSKLTKIYFERPQVMNKICSCSLEHEKNLLWSPDRNAIINGDSYRYSCGWSEFHIRGYPHWDHSSLWDLDGCSELHLSGRRFTKVPRPTHHGSGLHDLVRSVARRNERCRWNYLILDIHWHRYLLFLSSFSFVNVNLNCHRLILAWEILFRKK